MSEHRILLGLLDKTEGRIAELRRRLEIQEGIRTDLVEQIEAIGGVVPSRTGPGVPNGESSQGAQVWAAARIIKPARPKVAKTNKPDTPDQIDSWADRIADIMRANGGTMRFGEIVNELERRGEKELGKHRLGSRVFGTLRRRKKRFERLSRGEYRLIS